MSDLLTSLDREEWTYLNDYDLVLAGGKRKTPKATERDDVFRLAIVIDSERGAALSWLSYICIRLFSQVPYRPILFLLKSSILNFFC